MQGQTAEALANLDMQVIETPPKFRIDLSQLLRCVDITAGSDTIEDEEALALAEAKTHQRAVDLMQEARQHLGTACKLEA